MLITGIEVRDLLSFDALDVRFQRGLNVIVGQNDVGKTNLIRLVKLVRDFVAASPSAGLVAHYGFEQRYVRLDGPGQGRVAVKVKFTESDEQTLLLLFVRAVAAQATEPQMNQAQPRTPDEWLALYQRIAEFVESYLDLEGISDLFEGQLVMEMDARHPARWSLAYEFTHAGEIFHVGIQGHTASVGAIARGTLDLDRPTWIRTQLNLSEKIDPQKTTWEPVAFADLLPLDQSTG